MVPDRRIPSFDEISRRSQFLILSANAAGALLGFFYFSYLDPLPTGASPIQFVEQNAVLFNILSIVVLLVVGILVSRYGERYIPTWYRKLYAEAARPEDVPEAARREVLNYPFFVAMTSLLMWTLAGIFLGLPFGLDGLFRILGISGVLTTALVYLLMEIHWRNVIPLFFPDGRLSSVRGFRLPIHMRLIFLFLIVAEYPLAMLALSAYSRAQGMVGAENPQVILDNMLWSMVFIFGVVVVLSAVITYATSRVIVQPLEKLQVAMEQVAGDDLTVQMEVTSKDEIGVVSERFNEMVAGLRQAELLRNLLNLYVSPEVARAAVEGGANLGGQVVECSVLFSDIRGFTSLSEQLSPDQLIETLNRYMSRMVDVVIDNGGIVNKFGGDSLLAVFGTPLNPAEDHAARAIRTALAMQKALVNFNLEQVKKNQPELQIGIGIASGPVVAGNIGGQGRIEYTVIGDTVNLASRLQDLTKELNQDVLVNSAAIQQATQSIALAAQPLGEIPVRGKAEKVNIFAVLSNLQEQA